MGAFYVSIIFLGILLIIGSLFFIAMDKVNGKDFFKEFDRKKEEMFNLIQDSEDMIQELNKISDYVVTTISEKNQEYFDKVNRQQGSVIYQPVVPIIKKHIESVPVVNNDASQKIDSSFGKEAALGKTEEQKEEVVAVIEDVQQKDISQSYEPKQNVETTEPAETAAFSAGPELPDKKSEAQSEQPKLQITGKVNTQMSNITDRINEANTNKSRLVLNNSRREVLKLIEQGMSNDEIADKLKIGKGEIGLIRGLSK